MHLGRAAAAQPPVALERDHRLELHLVREAPFPCPRSGFSYCRRAGITRGDFVRAGKEHFAGKIFVHESLGATRTQLTSSI